MRLLLVLSVCTNFLLFDGWRFKALSFLVIHCLIFLGYLCIALKQSHRLMIITRNNRKIPKVDVCSRIVWHSSIFMANLFNVSKKQFKLTHDQWERNKAEDNCDKVGVIFIDFPKAFDCVDHCKTQGSWCFRWFVELDEWLYLQLNTKGPG